MWVAELYDPFSPCFNTIWEEVITNKKKRERGEREEEDEKEEENEIKKIIKKLIVLLKQLTLNYTFN